MRTFRARRAVFLSSIILCTPVLSRSEMPRVDPCSLEASARHVLLQFRKDIPFQKVSCQVLGQSAMTAFSRKLLSHTVNRKKLKAEGEFYRALKLIPPDFAYEQEIAALYSEASVGVYDSWSKSLKILETVSGAELLDTMIHELNHGFQDQFVGLEKLRDQSLSSDELLARSALIEGDSLLVEAKLKSTPQYQVLLGKLGPTRTEIGPSVSPSSFPPSLQKLFLFSYGFGPKYIQTRFVGKEIVPLKELFSPPPHSTSQILHPERKLEKQTELKLEIQLPATLHLRRTFSDRVGEYFLSLLLQFTNSPEELSSQWLSDRVEIFSDAEIRQGVGVWEIKLSDARSAKKLSEVLQSFYNPIAPGSFELSTLEQCVRLSWSFPKDYSPSFATFSKAVCKT